MLPLPGDEPTTLPEQLDAMEDLDCLLFGDTSRSDAKPAWSSLESTAFRNISEALVADHNEASLAVVASAISAVTASKSASIAKRTADACRSLVAKLALECETDATAWKALVGETTK